MSELPVRGQLSDRYPAFDELHGFIDEAITAHPDEAQIGYYYSEPRANASLLYLSPGSSGGVRVIEEIELARKPSRNNFLPARYSRYTLGEDTVPLQRLDCYHSPIVPQLTYEDGKLGLVQEPLHKHIGDSAIEGFGLRWGYRRHAYATKLVYGDTATFNAHTDALNILRALKGSVELSPEQTAKTAQLIEHGWYDKALRRQVEQAVGGQSRRFQESTVLLGGICGTFFRRSS